MLLLGSQLRYPRRNLHPCRQLSHLRFLVCNQVVRRREYLLLFLPSNQAEFRQHNHHPTLRPSHQLSQRLNHLYNRLGFQLVSLLAVRQVNLLSPLRSVQFYYKCQLLQNRLPLQEHHQ